jgi:hypothetical protein
VWYVNFIHYKFLKMEDGFVPNVEHHSQSVPQKGKKWNNKKEE